MASARFAWGIDVGNRALKAVKLVRDGDGFRVDDFEFIEHETFLSQSGDNRDALINAWDEASAGWVNLPPEALENLATACKAGAEAVTQSAKAVCGW